MDCLRSRVNMIVRYSVRSVYFDGRRKNGQRERGLTTLYTRPEQREATMSDHNINTARVSYQNERRSTNEIVNYRVQHVRFNPVVLRGKKKNKTEFYP